MLGKVRKDELPELEKGIDEGWRMIPAKLQSPKDVPTWQTRHTRNSPKWSRTIPARPGKYWPAAMGRPAWALQWQPAKH